MVIEHCHLENSLASRIESDQVGSLFWRSRTLALANCGSVGTEMMKPAKPWIPKIELNQKPKNKKKKKTKKRTTSNNHVKSVVKSVDLIPTAEESDSNHFRIVSAFSFDMGFKSNLVHILLSIARKELKGRHGTQSIGTQSIGWYPSHMDCLKTCTTAAI